MCSKEGQDLFALYVLNGLKSGKFLDIGCEDPINGNNTIRLERDHGWNGLCVDIVDRGFAASGRRARFIQGDARKIDWAAEVKEGAPVKVVDYLSIDIDEATSEFMDVFPWESILARVITIEHDAYRFGEGPRAKQRKILAAAGYSLVCSNVSFPGEDYPKPFEDWWVLSREAWNRCHHLISDGLLFQQIIAKIYQ